MTAVATGFCSREIVIEIDVDSSRNVPYEVGFAASIWFH